MPQGDITRYIRNTTKTCTIGNPPGGACDQFVIVLASQNVYLPPGKLLVDRDNIYAQMRSQWGHMCAVHCTNPDEMPAGATRIDDGNGNMIGFRGGILSCISDITSQFQQGLAAIDDPTIVKDKEKEADDLRKKLAERDAQLATQAEKFQKERQALLDEVAKMKVSAAGKAAMR